MGFLAAKLPGLDAIFIAPDYWGAHTPTERMSVSSFQRGYDYLLDILKQLCNLY